MAAHSRSAPLFYQVYPVRLIGVRARILIFCHFQIGGSWPSCGTRATRSTRNSKPSRRATTICWTANWSRRTAPPRSPTPACSAKIGVLTADEADKLAAELAAIAADSRSGAFTVEPADEDCHTAIENRLVARLGDLGKKIHTCRSRNDQVIVARASMPRPRCTSCSTPASASRRRSAPSPRSTRACR